MVHASFMWTGIDPWWVGLSWSAIALGICVTALWLISIPLVNVSIIDIFWGPAFAVSAFCYWLAFHDIGASTRQYVLLGIVTTWALRLAVYLTYRNWGIGEDYRYQNFRQKFGPTRYWWISYFQVFLMQGVLAWIISLPIAFAMFGSSPSFGTPQDIVGLVLWSIGFIFEAGGDTQLAIFKSNPQNKGKLLTTGLWALTRHPNYFGDACMWWGYFLIATSVQNGYQSVFSPVIMTFLLMKVSGVALLEKSMKAKPGYEEYMKQTSSFFPWLPAKKVDASKALLPAPNSN